jgi:hypothetical protein
MKLLLRRVYLTVSRARNRRLTVKTVRKAGKVLSEKLGEPVGLEIREIFHEATARCTVARGPRDISPTVIVKRAKPTGRNRFDPTDANPGGVAYRLYNEWAGLEFLGRAPMEGSPTPRFLGGDRESGFVVVEDVGEEDLDEVLMASEPRKAHSALVRYSSILGQVHAGTANRLDEYRQIRSALGPDAAPADEVWGTRPFFTKRIEELRGIFVTIGFEPGDGFYDELEQVNGAIGEPGPFLTYTHGDPGPDNLRIAAGRSVLIDFEHGNLRHALTDAVYGRMPFPTSWRVNRIPKEIVKDMEASYRSELIKGCLEVGVESRFSKALVDACAYWVTTKLAFSLQKPSGPHDRLTALERDHNWGISTLRQIVLASLEAFVDTAGEFGLYPGLERAFVELHRELSGRWNSPTGMPYYPAFRRMA